MRERLSLFPNNAILNQYFAYFSTALFFVETSRRQLQTTIEIISPLEVRCSARSGRRFGKPLGAGAGSKNES